MSLPYIVRKEWNEAEKCLLKAIDLNPRFPLAYRNLGLVREDAGRCEQSIEPWRKVLEQDPNAGRILGPAFLRVGLKLAAQHKLADAETALRLAVRCDSLSLDAHYQLGQFLEQTNRTTEAVQEYKTAVALAPRVSMYRDALSSALKKAGGN
jgi:superkiller protein 3